jgi:hypothetical protein
MHATALLTHLVVKRLLMLHAIKTSTQLGVKVLLRLHATKTPTQMPAKLPVLHETVPQAHLIVITMGFSSTFCILTFFSA